MSNIFLNQEKANYTIIISTQEELCNFLPTTIKTLEYEALYDYLYYLANFKRAKLPIRAYVENNVVIDATFLITSLPTKSFITYEEWKLIRDLS